MAVRIPVTGAQLGVYLPHDIWFLKIFSPTEGEYLDYVSTADDFDDGAFTLLLPGEDTPYRGIISRDANYDLAVFIKDGGKFDLDGKVNGAVVDPLVIVNSIPDGGKGEGGGGGGCNTAVGYALIALLTFCFFAKGRKK